MYVAFALAAFAGVLFAGLGPVAFVRGLGFAAAFGAALGMLVALAGCRLAFREAHATATTKLPADDADADATETLPAWPGVTTPGLAA